MLVGWAPRPLVIGWWEPLPASALSFFHIHCGEFGAYNFLFAAQGEGLDNGIEPRNCSGGDLTTIKIRHELIWQMEW